MDEPLSASVRLIKQGRLYIGSVMFATVLVVAVFLANAAIRPPLLVLDDIRIGVVGVEQRQDRIVGFGEIRGGAEQYIVSPSDAIVLATNFGPGEFVERGQVVFELRNPGLESDLRTASLATIEATKAEQERQSSLVLRLLDARTERKVATANHVVAEEELKATEELASRGAVSELELARARASAFQSDERVKAAESLVAELESLSEMGAALNERLFAQLSRVEEAALQKLETLSVRAQLSGRLDSVSEEMPQPGDHVSLGQKLARIADTSTYIAELSFAAVYLPEIRVGASAEIDVLGSRAKGSVLELNPSIINQRFTARIGFYGEAPLEASPNLRIDGHVLGTGTSPKLVLPRPDYPVVRGTNNVLRIDREKGLAESVQIQVIDVDDDSVVVGAGLEAGDEVVLSIVEEAMGTRTLRINDGDNGE